jgi:hypothetical protein
VQDGARLRFVNEMNHAWLGTSSRCWSMWDGPDVLLRMLLTPPTDKAPADVNAYRRAIRASIARHDGNEIPPERAGRG